MVESKSRNGADKNENCKRKTSDDDKIAEEMRANKNKTRGKPRVRKWNVCD